MDKKYNCLRTNRFLTEVDVTKSHPSKDIKKLLLLLSYIFIVLMLRSGKHCFNPFRWFMHSSKLLDSDYYYYHNYYNLISYKKYSDFRLNHDLIHIYKKGKSLFYFCISCLNSHIVYKSMKCTPRLPSAPIFHHILLLCLLEKYGTCNDLGLKVQTLYRYLVFLLY
jgi:hypothetical protein